MRRVSIIVQKRKTRKDCSWRSFCCSRCMSMGTPSERPRNRVLGRSSFASSIGSTTDTGHLYKTLQWTQKLSLHGCIWWNQCKIALSKHSQLNTKRGCLILQVVKFRVRNKFLPPGQGSIRYKLCWKHCNTNAGHIVEPYEVNILVADVSLVLNLYIPRCGRTFVKLLHFETTATKRPKRAIFEQEQVTKLFHDCQNNKVFWIANAVAVGLIRNAIWYGTRYIEKHTYPWCQECT